MNEQNQAIEKSLQEVISKEASKELANIEGDPLKRTFDNLYEQMSIKGLLPAEPTVKSVVQELYELSECVFPDGFTIGELQYQVYAQVELLVDLLGIDLG